MKKRKRSKLRKRFSGLRSKFILDLADKEHGQTLEIENYRKSVSSSKQFWKKLWSVLSKISLLLQIIKEVIETCSNLWF